jgi:hypothetical protein
MWEELLFVLIVIIIIVVLFKFGLDQKERDQRQLEKYFKPKQ